MASACTIVARNYLAHARVLADSFYAHHPGGDFSTLLIDDEPRRADDERESFRCLRLRDIGFTQTEIGCLAGIYDVTELATAVKPRFLRYLLGEGRSDVIYFDPDIKIYDSLEHVSELARQHTIVLTPHTMAPLPRDGRRLDDFNILSSGVYNLGFIAVGGKSGDFIDWWWDRTRREALVDPRRMMFTDQRWIDFVPSFFNHFILKDPACNVAYWNLHARDLTFDGGGYRINGEPLRFFHFSGFDARKPHLLSKHQTDRPRILISERPALARICKEYVESLNAADFVEQSRISYGWSTLASGIPFDHRMRRLYRESLQRFEEGEGIEPPAPFDPATTDRFMEWLNEPAEVGMFPRVPRYVLALYDDRIDLQRAFPDLAGDDRRAYFDWVRRHAASQEHLPSSLIPVATDPEDDRATEFASPLTLIPGVNVAGYFRAELGVGEAARLLTRAVADLGVPVSTVAYEVTLSRKAQAFEDRGDRRAPHDINIVCVNADQTPGFAHRAGKRFFEGRHTIGYWFWELDDFPTTMHPAFDFVDEVWTASEFAAGAIRTASRKPVHAVPLPLLVPVCSKDVTRETLGLDDRFMFLFIFDLFSVMERKNPIGLIRAFTRAFPSGHGPMLVIKTLNGVKRLNDLEAVRAAAAGRPDVLIIDQYYSAEEKNALLSLCDCYVSLHRSEGLGLTMAEAMGLGRPVIATGYSGNLEFMTPENSFLVDYSMTAVPSGCDPYPPGTQWADPDLNQAAEFMRFVYENKEAAARRAEIGRQDILARHNVSQSSRVLEKRLKMIRESLGRVETTHETVEPSPPLDRYAPLLTPTPASSGGGLGWFRRMAQRVLFRILRPYWFQQRQLVSMLIQELEEVQAVNASFKAKWREKDALEHAVRALEAGQTRNAAETERVRTAATVFQESAVAHLAILSEQAAKLTGTAGLLQQRLHAAPAIGNFDRFRLVDESGRKGFGFRGGRGRADTSGDSLSGIFSGSGEPARRRFRRYVQLLERHEQVVDIGCGRGELLDMLKEAGVQAEGVDADPSMVALCRAKGHIVQPMDALSYLRERANTSVPAIVATALIEYLPATDVIAFFQASRCKLRPGGQLIVETANPHALDVFKTFWTDVRRERPIFPEVAVSLCWLAGFEQAYLLYPNGIGDIDQDRMTQREYAIVATA